LHGEFVQQKDRQPIASPILTATTNGPG
jgi:hypothetical protein